MFRRFLLTLVFLLGFSFVYSTVAHAAVDISLEDDPEQGEVSVIVNSNGSYVDGLDSYIVYSDDVEIEEVSFTEDYCGFSGNSSFSNGRISIECLNDTDTEIDGVLATIKYSTDTDDYFFYLDESYLDLGSLTLGNVENINRPEDISFDQEVEEIEEDDDGETFWEMATEFLRNNSLYVLAGVITFIALLVLIVGSIQKKQV